MQIFLIRDNIFNTMFDFLESGCKLILSKHGPFTAFIPVDTSQVSNSTSKLSCFFFFFTLLAFFMILAVYLLVYVIYIYFSF